MNTLILLAEDESLIRLATSAAIEEDGMEVMEAGSASDALVLLTTHAHLTHVLFTDIRMPGEVDGLQLAHYASQHWPWIGLLITSAALPLRALSQAAKFPQKPYYHATAIEHIRALRGTLPRA